MKESKPETLNVKVEAYGRSFLLTLMQLANAYIIVFSEEEPKIGTLAVATAEGLSSILLGGRRVLLAKTLASYSARRLNGLALLSLNVSEEVGDREATEVFSRLLEKTTRKGG